VSPAATIYGAGEQQHRGRKRIERKKGREGVEEMQNPTRKMLQVMAGPEETQR
jgi:hypothetical protein